ncbi:MAG: VCBS repeat-containing protein [Verrucomicrobia bacterium]|nr:VCBS repeat-containing protein [Verrucomicrobiota bacterium]
MIAADFNGDGKLDLVAANVGSTNAFVLLGIGDGNFQPPVAYATGLTPFSMAVGDFNGDGKPDLAVANLGSTNVSVLLGTGDGSFQQTFNLATDTAPTSVAVGDFNGDGKLDLAVASRGSYDVTSFNYTNGAVSIFLNSGGGTFKLAVNYPGGNFPNSLVVADLDGDGKPDLAVLNSITASVSVLINAGDGIFKNPLTIATAKTASSGNTLLTGDFNHDGKADLAAVTPGSGSISVLINKGDGGFQAAVYYDAGDDAFAVATGDVNGDGVLDFAVVIKGGVSILLGRMDGGFIAPLSYDAYGSVINPGSIAIGDFNGDGKADLAVTVRGNSDIAGSGFVSVRLGLGTGNFGESANYRAGATPISVAVADVNTDGRLDLVVINDFKRQEQASVSVLLGKVDGTFQDALNFDLSSYPTSVAVGDFNGDGRPDIVVGHSSAGVVMLIGEGDGSFRPRRFFSTGGGVNSVVIGDFNGDGRLDVATGGKAFLPGTGNISILLGKGDGTFQDATNYYGGLNAASLAMSDLNGDGKLDLVAGNFTVLTNLVVLLGNGNGTFQPAARYTIANLPNEVAVADFNGDGKPDLVLATDNGLGVGSLQIMVGNGDGTFQKAIAFDAGVFLRALAVGELNGDGTPDVVVATPSSRTISILLNTCTAPLVRPGLSTTRAANALGISWPFPSTGFVFESSTNVAATNWLPAIEVAKTNGGRWEVTAPMDWPQRFFRLRKP